MSHEEAWSLLPWYVNGRLEEAERARVRRHLADCDRCLDEVAAQRTLRDSMTEGATVDYAPQGSLAKLMERVAASEAGRGRWRIPVYWKSGRVRPPRPFAQLGLRPLMIAVGAQAIVIVMLMLAAGWLMLNFAAPARYQTLTDRQAVYAASGELMRVVFDGSLPLSEVQDLLRAIDARIVDGPTAAGVYTIERAAGATQRNREAAQWLREQPGVRFAEPVLGRN